MIIIIIIIIERIVIIIIIGIVMVGYSSNYESIESRVLVRHILCLVCGISRGPPPPKMR